MAHADPFRDDLPPVPGRNETPTERLDRNWNELLQELRIAQTGTQVFAGFLLSLPFQQRFGQLTTAQRALYLTAFSLATLATVLLIAPVSSHRLLFRQNAKRALVRLGDRLAKCGLVALALGVTCATVLIFDVVAGLRTAVAVGTVTLVMFGATWLALPLGTLGRQRRAHPDDAPDSLSRPAG